MNIKVRDLKTGEVLHGEELLRGDGIYLAFSSQHRQFVPELCSAIRDCRGQDIGSGDKLAVFTPTDPQEVVGSVRYDESLGALVVEMGSGGWEFLYKYVRENRNVFVI